jgi:hypothetical protein
MDTAATLVPACNVPDMRHYLLLTLSKCLNGTHGLWRSLPSSVGSKAAAIYDAAPCSCETIVTKDTVLVSFLFHRSRLNAVITHHKILRCHMSP